MSRPCSIRARLDDLTQNSPTSGPGSVYVMRDALRAVIDACDDEDLRPGGSETIPTECVREEIAIALGLMEREL